jgi:peroxiredoxin
MADASTPLSPRKSVPSVTYSRNCCRRRPFSRIPLSAFSDYVLHDAVTRKPIPLYKLCLDRPIVLVFLRRLGCQLCRLRAAEIEAARPAIEQAGCYVVAITFEYLGEGSDSDNSWSRSQCWNGPLLTDPTKELYRTLFKRKGFFDNFYGVFDVSTKRIKEAAKRGLADGSNYSGDGFMLGGLIVVDRYTARGVKRPSQGQILDMDSDIENSTNSSSESNRLGDIILDHRSEFFGDDYPVSDLLILLRKAKSPFAKSGEPLEPIRDAGVWKNKKRIGVKANVDKACASPHCLAMD